MSWLHFNFLRGPGAGHLDISRMGWALGVVSAVGFTGAHLYLNHQFDIMQFGTGFGLLMAGGGGSTAVKDIAVARAMQPPSDAP